jgi:tetratricopeptide (TPR) repeat protein
MRAAWIFVGIAALIGAIYGRSIAWDFIGIDDKRYVSANTHVLDGISVAGMRWAFTTLHDQNWVPLTWLSLMADTSIHGAFAGGYRLTNIALHAVNAMLVFCLLYSATDDRLRSATVAAIFAVHPIHVESVVWISERKDTLSICFGLLALIAYFQFARSRRIGLLICSWLAFACSLLAKQTLVTLPFLLLLLDDWPLGRFKAESVRRLLVEKLPFLALSIAMCWAAYHAQTSLGATTMLGSLTLEDRLANALAAYGQYLMNVLWPTRLAFFYPFPHYGLLALPVVVSSLMLVAITGWAAFNVRRWPHLFVGWFWFLGTLVPMIGVVQIGRQQLADRYAYFPMIGLYVALVWSAPRRVVALAGTAVVIASAFLAFAQVGYWRNSETLFRRALAVAADNETVRGLYGGTLIEDGRIEEGLAQLRMAVALAPRDHFTHARLAKGLVAAGRDEEAIREYRVAISIRDDRPSAFCQLAAVLARTGHAAEAKACFDKAVRLMPELKEIAVSQRGESLGEWQR